MKKQKPTTECKPLLTLKEICDTLDSHTNDTFRFSPVPGVNKYADMELIRSSGGVRLGDIEIVRVDDTQVTYVVKGAFTQDANPITDTIAPGEEKTYSYSESRTVNGYEGKQEFTFRRVLTLKW